MSSYKKVLIKSLILQVCYSFEDFSLASSIVDLSIDDCLNYCPRTVSEVVYFRELLLSKVVVSSVLELGLDQIVLINCLINCSLAANFVKLRVGSEARRYGNLEVYIYIKLFTLVSDRNN